MHYRLFLQGCVFAAGVMCAAVSNAQVTYSTIMGSGDSVTGVRGTGTDNSGNALVTGSQIVGSAPQTLLWDGNLYTGVGTSYSIMPQETGTVSSSNFYGPDTPAFNSSIPVGQIRAVGTYAISGSAGTFGFMYTGSLVSGTYGVTEIDVPGATSTIPHSTAGNIVVGAYDNGSPSTGNAFIYSITSGTYQTLSIGAGATLYGVWQTGTNSYVVAGGAPNPDASDVSEAFLANYDSSTGLLSDESYYAFTGSNGLYNHFEGITAVDGGYELIATITGTTGLDTPVGSALAFVGVNSGTFASTADWTVLDYPDSTVTTGNTVYETTGMGVYETSTSSGSYTAQVSAVPEPGTSALTVAALVSVGLVVLARRKLRSQAV